MRVTSIFKAVEFLQILGVKKNKIKSFFIFVVLSPCHMAGYL